MQRRSRIWLLCNVW